MRLVWDFYDRLGCADTFDDRCSADMSDQQLESKLWERPQFLHNRVPLGGWEFDGWVPCGPFPVFLFLDQVNGFLRVINATARHGR